MSIIEGDGFYPLFNTSEIPLDFAAVPTNLTDSPGFRQLKKISSNDVSAPQTVPGASPQSPDEPLFQLFMSGGIDKLEFPLNSTLLKGLQMTDDMLLNSGLIQKSLASGEIPAGMDFKGLGLSTMVANDAGVVPDFQAAHISKANIDEPSKGNNANKKRKFVQPASPIKSGEPICLSPVEQMPISLTPEDERNAKRQRRLVKNREAAQLFRQRQKAYIQDLEKRVGDLTASNNEFRARVELLNSENKLIKEQLIYLRNFITQSPGSPNGAGPTMSPNGSPNAMSGIPISLPPGLNLPPGLFNMSVPNMAMLSGMGTNFSHMPMQANFPMGMAPIPPPSGMHHGHMSPHHGSMSPPPPNHNHNHNQNHNHGAMSPTPGMMSPDTHMHQMSPSTPSSSSSSDSDDKSKIKLIK